MAELASCTIYIKGIATTATEADVRDACSQYGNITEVAIPEGKDFCFVEFAEEAQAQVGKKTTRPRRRALRDHMDRNSASSARRLALLYVCLAVSFAPDNGSIFVNVELGLVFFGRLFLPDAPPAKVLAPPTLISHAEGVRLAAALSLAAAGLSFCVRSCVGIVHRQPFHWFHFEEFLSAIF